ncbi:MAG: hypothetical protein PHO80_00485 [Candidatus Gracilibacteria bacterium]|nr:hypothetical protein [Candidatus Gracilibacteria bacterium]
MKSFEKFYFKGFDFNKAEFRANFYYSFDDEVNFTETIDFNCVLFEIRKNLDDEILNNLLFHLSIALGISYYKLYPTKDLVVESGKLDDFQIKFWQKMYLNGLSEFLYRNKISPKGLFNFVNSSEKEYKKIDFETNPRALLAIGGGKDSLVSSELLRESGIDFTLITFGKDYLLHQATEKAVGKNRILIKRQISPNLFELSANYYNGHVPITGIIAFVLEVVAYLYDYKYIVLSNERSANYGNTTREGIKINHQYSKSLEFEKDLEEFVEKYISSEVKYFSLLRGMYEVKIAQIFSKYKQYFNVFSSCNNNFKIIESNKTTKDRWCLNCPKCAFVYTILRSYLTNDETIEIFGKEMFEDLTQEQVFRDLLGISGIKPFECVGTNEEVILSMKLSFDKFKKEGKTIPFILKIFEKEVLSKMHNEDFENLSEKLLKVYDENIIPEEILSKLNL